MKPASAMEETVAALIAPGKGILAADESFPTIEKRLNALTIESTEENRRLYRELLVTTPGLNECIGGVILFDETIRQRTRNHVPMADHLAAQGIIPGIKVDSGTSALAHFAGEKFTQGLDGLRDRLAEYRDLGARFTKWRAVLGVGERIPTRTCLEVNAGALAQFAALSQEAGLVPVVEPEVLMDGNHTIERCEMASTATLQAVFAALAQHGVVLERMLLKTGMMLAGTQWPEQADLQAVTHATLRCFRRAVPAAVPGILFLSGGQEAQVATERLAAICRGGGTPWTLSFSFGRALQSPVLQAWKGEPANVDAAQAALRHRAKCNGLALRGHYSEQAERRT